ncbi:MAG: metalloregulator ArsR/SmtB family transcription factor [Patescibacteria group bacterium]
MELKVKEKKEIQEWLRASEAKEFEKVLKALANKRRLAIVKFLKKKGEGSVQEIAEVIALSFKSTSRHLALLSSAEILEKEQKSTRVFYRISKVEHAVVSRAISLL